MAAGRWRRWVAGATVVAAVGLAACSEDTSGTAANTGASTSDLSGTITVDGSSTVAPLTSAAAELFAARHPGVDIPVGTSGTGGGFKKLCAGEIDIADASRPIKADDEEEGVACTRRDIAYEEIQVANDGLAVVVNRDNDWAECLTVEQLKRIWAPAAQGKVTRWNQVDRTFPDEKLTLYGAGTASGTFDYFTEAIVGEEGSSRSDYAQTEDDNTTVQGVSGDRGALGYFGLSYYEENRDKLKIVRIDAGDGCVEPTTETVQDGTYRPLSRPLFIYPTDRALQRPEVRAFVEFCIDESEEIAEAALFVPMTATQRQDALALVQRLAAG